MEIKSKHIVLRPYTLEDAEALASIANSRKISKNLRDAFPYPYSIEDAKNFITMCEEKEVQAVFAIIYKGHLAGSIGLHPLEDVYRRTAEIGYFVGEEFWGKAIATKSVEMITKFGFESLHLTRIFAGIFESNRPSMRVLEKNGFILECIKRRAVLKDNKILNEHLYAKLND